MIAPALSRASADRTRQHHRSCAGARPSNDHAQGHGTGHHAAVTPDHAQQPLVRQGFRMGPFAAVDGLQNTAEANPGPFNLGGVVGWKLRQVLEDLVDLQFDARIASREVGRNTPDGVISSGSGGAAHRRTARLAGDYAGISDMNDVVLTIVVHRRCRFDEAVAVSNHISPKVRAGRSRHRPQASAGDMGAAIGCERFAP